MRIREMKSQDLEAVLTFADKQIGQDYFTEEKLQRIIQSSEKNEVMCSFVLEDVDGIQAIRLTYPPGQWLDRDERQPIHPHLWKVPQSETAYFQSLFLSTRYAGQGWGQRMSMASIENLKKLKTQAVVCHSWDESPFNSSRRYLDRLGFEAVISIPNYWKCIDYECTRCGRPCVCTATEMVLYL
jgi:ribosomal protein S18 acetylase RimI-like enzyme